MQKREGLNKKGALELSFGMIVSIILIIFFIAFSFYAITKLLDWQNSLKVAKFTDNLKANVNTAWSSNLVTISTPYTLELPSKVDYVCFADGDSPTKGASKTIMEEAYLSFNDGKNMFFYPATSVSVLNPMKIEHLNIEKMTQSENPYCIKMSKGKATIIIKRDRGESLVSIIRG